MRQRDVARPASGLSTVKSISFAVEELRVDLFNSGDGAFRTFGAFWSRAQLARSGAESTSRSSSPSSRACALSARSWGHLDVGAGLSPMAGRLL